MIKYILLLIPLFFVAFGFDDSFGVPPPPPTSYKITLVDESNSNLEAPAFLLVTEMLHGEQTSYRIDIRNNPEEINASWYAPATEINTEIHIVAAKQGFENSDEFIFTITNW